MIVHTITKHGKAHKSDCPTLFEALELIDGLLQIGDWQSITLDGLEFIEERRAA